MGEQEFVSIVGPGEHGTTTLPRLIAGRPRPTSGRIIFAEEPSLGVPPDR
jgi:ABC-type Fe3+/spermidine/putrescine transport system ATPase subunit